MKQKHAVCALTTTQKHIPALVILSALLLAVSCPLSAAVPAGLSASDWSGILQQFTPAQQAYLKASNTGATDVFGFSVAVSGDTVVIGANWEDSGATGVNGDQSDNTAPDSGAVYVFVRDGTTWTQQAYLKASNTGAGDEFGKSVAISGDTIVVGARFEDSGSSGVNADGNSNSATDSGAAYIFVRNGTNWTQQAYVKPLNPGLQNLFGFSVAISGETVVVGAIFEDNGLVCDDVLNCYYTAPDSGGAYVFVRNGITWSQQAYLEAANAARDDNFGFSVAVSGDTIVVGALAEDSNASGVNGNQSDNSAFNSGAAYVFACSGTTWTQQGYLKASNTGARDQFGNAVAISAETVVVTANREDSNATGVNGDENDNSFMDSGAAYIFVRDGTNWAQQAYLKASNTGAGDLFGWSVAVSGDTVVVGTLIEDSNATGVNGNQSDNSVVDSGAAYVFVRNGTTWSQQTYLKASNTGALDQFGVAVAISGETVVVGANREDSAGIGVNGDQGDGGVDSGAAYVFTGLGIGPRLTLMRDGSGGYFIRFNGAPDVTYRLQRATSVTGSWDTIATPTAPASGLVEHHDTNPPNGQAFYRVVLP